jgi:hypothetical protein
MKLIIAGSRNFNNYPKLKEECDRILEELYFKEVYTDLEPIEIVSGHAQGADQLGEKYARDGLYNLKIIKAEWERYGKSAGFLRNERMARYAKDDKGTLICFWDGKSSGTKNMIELGKQYNLRTYIIKF